MVLIEDSRAVRVLEARDPGMLVLLLSAARMRAPVLERDSCTMPTSDPRLCYQSVEPPVKLFVAEFGMPDLGPVAVEAYS